MADDGHGAPVKFSQSRDDRLVIGVATVPVQFDKIREQQTDKIQRVGTLLVTRDLRALPRPQVRIKFAPQFRDLLADTLQFGVGMRVPGQVTQFLDVFFQAFDFPLALDFYLAVALFRTVGGRRAGFGFFFCAHSGTIRTAGLPQISRTASTNSGVVFTRCCACSTAIEPSGEHNSNTTWHGPGAAANKSSRRSRASSLSVCISIRTRRSLETARSGISSSRR